MGLFDRVGRMFETDSERRRRIAKERRQAFRQADVAINSVVERIGGLQERREQQWEEARVYIQKGQKGAARRALQGVRATDLIIDQLEKKRFVFEQLVIRFEVSKTDEEFATALGSLNAVIQIDVDTVEDVLDIAQEKLGDQLDVDRAWQRVHEREMGEVMTSESDVVPSVEDMLETLEMLETETQQAAPQVTTATETATETTAAPAQTESPDSEDMSRQIGEGRRRIKDLMEGDQ